MVARLTPEQRAELAAKNRALLPNVTALLEEVRSVFPMAKLIYGLDKETGYEIGTEGAHEVHALDRMPRKVRANLGEGNV